MNHPYIPYKIIPEPEQKFSLNSDKKYMGKAIKNILSKISERNKKYISSDLYEKLKNKAKKLI